MPALCVMTILILMWHLNSTKLSACQCDNDHRYTGNCAPESGECECKPAFKGAKDCSACADGYYDYPECKPCDCFANGTT